MSPAAVCLAGALLCGVTQQPQTAAKVKVLVLPILEAACEAQRSPEYNSEASGRAEALVGELSALQGPAADEALVVLLDYYYGETAAEDTEHAITKRGGRMMPYLAKYKSHPTWSRIMHGDCDRAIRLDRDTRDAEFRRIMAAIKAGKILGSD